MNADARPSGEVVGEGLTSWVVVRSDQEVVKIYKPGFPLAAIDYEKRILTALSASHVDLPRLVGTITEGGRPALVMERARGRSLLRILIAAPWRAPVWMRRFAEHHAALHRERVVGLPSQSERFADTIRRSGLTDSAITRLLDEVSAMPTAETCCHGDFHPDNVLAEGDRLTTLDWMNAYSGHPAGDVVRTWLMLRTPFSRFQRPLLERLMTALYQAWLSQTYAREMRRREGLSRSDFRRWIPLVCAARLSDGVPGERDWLVRQLVKAKRIYWSEAASLSERTAPRRSRKASPRDL